METISIGQVLQNCCTQIQGTLAGRDIRLCLELDRPDGFFVTGDRLLLESLFENLLTNAVKSFDHSGTIRVSCDGRTVWVQDNGRGIPAADLPHVRKAFYMADKSRSRRQQGAGLGLALAQRIVELHQAVMEIESREGVGTRVSVTFPEIFTNRSQNGEDFRQNT